jgi:hypothetical protein
VRAFCRLHLILSLLAVLTAAAGPVSARAEEPQAAPAAAAPPPAPAAVAPKKSRNPKGKHSRDTEAEGTEAQNRFQADTVIKSKYQLNGEQLEVDPD